jgi:hypothetical protein
MTILRQRMIEDMQVKMSPRMRVELRGLRAS